MHLGGRSRFVLAKKSLGIFHLMTSLIAKPLPRSTLYWMWSARDCVKNGAAWEAATVCLLEKKASLIAQSMRLRAAAWVGSQ